VTEGLAQARAAVEAVLAEHDEASPRRLDEDHWMLSLPGEVRLRIPVAIELSPRGCVISSFLLRGPRRGAGDLHRVLLRKNAHTARVRFALDSDDDVVLVARLSLAGTTPAELETVLGELYALADGAFEGLVHLGYPGVFPPLRR
jgi:hypothetical protein